MASQIQIQDLKHQARVHPSLELMFVHSGLRLVGRVALANRAGRPGTVDVPDVENHPPGPRSTWTGRTDPREPHFPDGKNKQGSQAAGSYNYHSNTEECRTNQSP